MSVLFVSYWYQRRISGSTVREFSWHDIIAERESGNFALSIGDIMVDHRFFFTLLSCAASDMASMDFQ